MLIFSFFRKKRSWNHICSCKRIEPLSHTLISVPVHYTTQSNIGKCHFELVLMLLTFCKISHFFEICKCWFNSTGFNKSFKISGCEIKVIVCNFTVCTINSPLSKGFICCIIKFSCKIWWIQLFENLLIPIIYRSKILASISIIDIIYNIVNFRFFESILKLISVWSPWLFNPIKHILPHLHISLMMLISKKTLHPKPLIIIIWKSAIKPLSLSNISYHCCRHNWSQTSILNHTFPTEKDFFERITFPNSTINSHSTWIINSSLK